MQPKEDSGLDRGKTSKFMCVNSSVELNEIQNSLFIQCLDWRKYFSISFLVFQVRARLQVLVMLEENALSLSSLQYIEMTSCSVLDVEIVEVPKLQIFIQYYCIVLVYFKVVTFVVF